MTIERWDPFREMISLRDAMNSLLGESFVRPGGPPATGGAATLPLDVAETEGEFVIKASLPGIKPEDVNITVHGDTLTIRGESKGEEERTARTGICANVACVRWRAPSALGSRSKPTRRVPSSITES